MTDRRRIFIIGTRILAYPRSKTVADAFGAVGETSIQEMSGTLRDQISCVWRIIRESGADDILVVMTPAEKLLIILIFARLFFRGRIIADTFISAYDTLVSDRALASPHGVKALYYSFLDQCVCLTAHILLFDTIEHGNYFRRRYYFLPRTLSLIAPISINTEEIDKIPPAFLPTLPPHDDRFTILFLGNYIPLQGVEYILRAFALLPDRKRFRLIMVGNGQTRPMADSLAKELGLTDVEFISRVPHKEAMALTKSVDLALGIFGNTEKATRVISNKILESMACRVPVLTGRNKDMERYFTENRDVYYGEMGNPQSIADAILRAESEKERRGSMTESARKIIETHFSLASLQKIFHDAF